jgi:hypothetical protein
MVPLELDPRWILAPDRKRIVEVVEKEKLIITDLASGKKREFFFHPYDRRSAYRDGVQWVNNRYLLFHGSPPELIDADALKINFPASKASGFSDFEFNRDFDCALGRKEDGWYLGTVQSSSQSSKTR